MRLLRRCAESAVINHGSAMLPSINREVDERLERLELPFNRAGIDPYGISKWHLRYFMRWLGFNYRYYFRGRALNIDNVPKRGRAMIVCNHSGGYAIDAGIVVAACFFDMDPPRLAQGMAEKFLARLPFAGEWTQKTGNFPGLPEHAARLLNDERLLMVFPEGVKGTAKLFKERYSLVRFGTGFLRLALETRTPIVPAAFLGGGEAVPTVLNLYKLGKLLGAPYVPVTPYLFATPLPVKVELHFGEIMRFVGTGNEEDREIAPMVDRVKQRIEELIENGRRDYKPLALLKGE
jgi:1-acyl-sn-glycerol-3-phosphate acyltransferase